MANEEKTEQATPKKKSDERKKGNIFQSKDITTALFIFVAFYALQLLAPFMYQQIAVCFKYFIDMASYTTSFGIADAYQMMIKVAINLAIIAGPIIIICALTNLILIVAQTKFLFSTELLKFKFSKLNPIEGIKRIISLRSLVEVVKSMLKIGIIGMLIYFGVLDLFKELPQILDMNILGVCVLAGKHIMSLVLKIGIVFLGIATLDFFYQRWDHEKKLKMSKHEVKQEYKQMEGDPLIRSKRRELQRQMAMRRMMQEVPNADVIIRNPTHFAVALQYKEHQARAPIVLAKGQEELALKIIEVGEKNQVAIVENPVLTRGIYFSTEIGQEIMPEYYQAVAEVLAWVYSLNKKDLKPR